VLARKWRPLDWEGLVGQEHVTATLKNAIRHNRLAHAYLFTGPRGVGKTSAARVLAKSLNCESGPTLTPCNQCSNCREITESRSVDVFEIDGASNRGIEEVRNLRENIRYSPAKGKYRIYIIDEVHMLTPEAFNALLKTLEEPPEHVVMIFATTEPHKIPATILSRCQRFDFRRMAHEDIIGQLRLICKSENVEIDEEALHLIARKADGSMRDSQSVLDQMISYTGKAITGPDVIQALGLIEQEVFFELTDCIIRGDTGKALDLLDRAIARGYDLEEFWSGLASHLRNALVLSMGGAVDLVEASEPDRKRYQELAAELPAEDLIRLIRITADASLSLKRNPNARIPIETAVVRMTKLDRTVRIEDLLAGLAEIQAQGTQAHSRQHPHTGSETGGQESAEPLKKNPVDPIPVKTGGTEPPVVSGASGSRNPAPDGPLTFETVQKRWEEIVEHAKKGRITIGSFLKEGVPVRLDGSVLEIGFANSNGFHVDAIMRCKGIVAAALKDVLGRELPFRCIRGEFSRSAGGSGDADGGPVDQDRQNATIQKLISDFDAEVVD
ncbi:DNA polymerase III subunit gamma/tau, partial [bacterium]|nr:DNA polymerase III subunit gamma/tau [bacterium]